MPVDELPARALVSSPPTPRRAEPSAPPASPRPLPALTRRASRNALAALVDYSAQLVTGLVVTPVLVGGLGAALYGAWEMLLRLGSYVSATDGRPTESLRLVIAQRLADSDSHAKRRQVGAALVVWLLLSPLLLSLGALFVFVAPTVVDAAPDAVPAVRRTATLLVAALLFSSLASVPESVLRGMNLGYRRMGVQAALHLVGGAMAAGAVWSGLGLAGLGGAHGLRALLTGLCFLLLVRRHVPWFGAERPSRAETGVLLRMSGWLTAGDVIAKVLLASDVIILGLVLGPAAVATYVLTGYAARVVVGVHGFTAGEALPGVGGLLGSREVTRAARARRELLHLTWLYATVAGTAILAWNPHFVAAWVGAELHAGRVVDLLVVLTAVQTAFIRVDSGIIDAALRPRERVAVGSVAALVTIPLAVLGTATLGVPGLCLGILAGRLIQSVVYPRVVHRTLRAAELAPAARAVPPRAWLTTIVLLALASSVGAIDGLSRWPTILLGVPLTIAFVAPVAMRVGAPPAMRASIVARLRALRHGSTP